MRPRKLDLASGRWRYLVGRTTVTIWAPSGRRHVVNNRKVTPDTSGAWYCCDRCEVFVGEVTPGKLRAMIERNLEHFTSARSEP